jgi:hypothetical protein
VKNTTIKIITLTHNNIVKDEVIVMDKKITCRPCKEKNNWEIENEFGVVLEKHYKTKDACVKAGQKLADECHCELCVCDTTSCSNE